MLALLQRVTHASVEVENQTIAKIEAGLLVFCAFEHHDNETNATALLNKCLNYRVFSDHLGKMNLSLLKIKANLLLVPQFTLAADTKRGLRPGFSDAAPPEQSKKLFSFVCDKASSLLANAQSAQFGADMKVSLCNDGPATFLLKQ